MLQLVLSKRRSIRITLVAVAFLLVGVRAHAQGIGFQGGATVDPEQIFVGTHLETRDLFQGLRFRPGIDGSWGNGFSLATINIEFIYRTPIGRSGWTMYQGGGPGIVLVRLDENTDVHAGSFFTFGFANNNGFFTEFRYGGNAYPTLKFGAGFTIRKHAP